MGSQRHRDQAEGTEMMPGVVRRTLAYNDDVMLCEFRLEGAASNLHLLQMQPPRSVPANRLHQQPRSPGRRAMCLSSVCLLHGGCLPWMPTASRILFVHFLYAQSLYH